MRLSWSEPYLWVHLAGVAAVPIFLELCLVGLTASQAVLPAGLVFLLVALAGISPMLWMQWHRPFSIFSLVILALQPGELTESQRKILQRFKSPPVRVAAVAVAIAAFLILVKLNQWAAAQSLYIQVPGGWFGGLLLATVAFLLSNLFLQVPASVLTVLLTPDPLLRTATPYPVAQIPTDFTVIGLPVKQILPPIALAAAVSTPPSAPTPAPVASTPPAPPQDFKEKDTVSTETADFKEPTIEHTQPESIQPDPPTPIADDLTEATDLTATESAAFNPVSDLVRDSVSDPVEPLTVHASTASIPEFPAPQFSAPELSDPTPSVSAAPELFDPTPSVSAATAADTIVTILLPGATRPLLTAPVATTAASQSPSVTDTVVRIIP